ncbi:MAG: hypothetical protein A7316_00795 [Candidatus Altiarchaeales archaeon WOR_SM1_86-2]|nr:MAG: hypothetical protein A7316_00795 [Candidatus Altiarchaeales archaeon WOR_SM1_86-2]ODS41713.1 MAG: hypothetical protein A7315_00565 [Candidatus Altiarchaeales archaeon WOR_SM1_79]
MKLKCRIGVAKTGGKRTIGVGDGRIKLLEAVDRMGSVNSASKEFGLSYPHAWRYIREVEEIFGKKLVNTKIGGRGGGSTTLTGFAKELIEEYNRFRKPLNEVIEKQFQETFKKFLDKEIKHFDYSMQQF